MLTSVPSGEMVSGRIGQEERMRPCIPESELRSRPTGILRYSQVLKYARLRHLSFRQYGNLTGGR